MSVQYMQPSSCFDDADSCAPHLGSGVRTTACRFGSAGNLGHSAGGDAGGVADTGLVPTLYAAWPLLPGTLQAELGINALFGLETKRDST